MKLEHAVSFGVPVDRDLGPGYAEFVFVVLVLFLAVGGHNKEGTIGRGADACSQHLGVKAARHIYLPLVYRACC